MKKEEVNMGPDGALILHPFEIERQARHCLAFLYSAGVLATAEKLLQLTRQAVWEPNSRLLGIVMDTIVSYVNIKPESTSDLALLCKLLVKEGGNSRQRTAESSKPSARELVVVACQNHYEAFWSQVLATIGEDERRTNQGYLKSVQCCQFPRGRALVLFIGYLYNMDVVPGSIVMHVLVEHGRNVIELPEDCLENLACLLEIAGPKLATSSRNNAALAQMLSSIEIAAENLRISLKRRLILRSLVLDCYNWEVVAVEEGGSSPLRGIRINEF